LDELELTRLSEEKFVDDFNNGIAMFYASSKAELSADVDALLKAAGEVGIPCAAVSSLSEERAAKLMETLGLTERGVELSAFEEEAEEDVFPRADTWMKVAKSMDKEPRHCAVLVSSADACKAALSAGMRCAGVPDSLTAFEDFGGAEMVVDDWQDVEKDALLAALFPIVSEG
jgi:beta-phosphoglucomutase-like phosphatase (HAD superfamily)